jgi:hypothetical protein
VLAAQETLRGRPECKHAPLSTTFPACDKCPYDFPHICCDTDTPRTLRRGPKRTGQRYQPVRIVVAALASKAALCRCEPGLAPLAATRQLPMFRNRIPVPGASCPDCSGGHVTMQIQDMRHSCRATPCACSRLVPSTALLTTHIRPVERECCAFLPPTPPEAPPMPQTLLMPPT